MQTEIEAKFLNIDHDAMRAKLTSLGAYLERSDRLMRRQNYDFPDKRLNALHAWARLRDEGDKITLTYKQLQDRGLHGTKEVNIIVDSFEQADKLLQALGLSVHTYQETRRESWTLNGVQIELDQWPWIKPFLEIEGPTENSVRLTAKLLGLDWDVAVHGSVEIAYQAEYDVTEAEIDAWPEILFTPVPDDLEKKRRKS
ncbi:MAG: class IV adenylate cyclase [Candidatus Saccharibacteria bacterium]